MGFNRNTIKKQNKKKKSRKSSGYGKSFSNVLDGSFLTQQGFLRGLPFVIFLAFLAMIYIANIYVAESKKREIEKLNKELKELRFEYVITKSKLMHLSKQSQVARRMALRGVKESRTPPKKIVIEKE